METLEHEKPVQEVISTIEHLKKQNGDRPMFKKEIERLESKLEKLKTETYSKLTPWQRVQICRHNSRPRSLDYIQNCFEEFDELSGDRLFADDQALVGGLAKIEGIPCVVIAQERGSNTQERLKHNFGSMHPEGYRKALRLMKLAEKFHLPVISLVDTQGAFPGLGAEERGQGWAIASNLKEMSQLKTPMVVAIIGEGCSGGALGIGVGDIVGMMEHAYYSVISTEGCASIFFKDSTKKEEAASMLKLSAEEVLQAGVIDEVIPEPLGGAHHDKNAAYENLKNFLTDKLNLLKHLPIPILLEERYEKLRKMGDVKIP